MILRVPGQRCKEKTADRPCVEAESPDGRLRSVLFAPGKTGDGLDGAAPVVAGRRSTSRSS